MSERELENLLDGWPTNSDRLISPGDVRFSGAYLGSFHRKLDFFASAYKLAGDKLVDAALAERGSNRDRLAWPTLATYRQCIELAIKELIGTALQALGLPVAIRNIHELDDLFSELKRLIVELDGHPDGIGFDAVEAMVLEFHNIDKNAQAFRYPHDRQGKEFVDVPSSIDLLELRESMERITLFFDCMSADISNRFSV